MDKKDLRIVYMGTADFALEPLKALVNQGFNIRAVVTMPDKPMGRGHKLQSSAIKLYAQEQGIEVLQPILLREANFLKKLKEIQADLQIVVAFRMLPEEVWAMPQMGTINLHGSLLPQYRGAAPINHALMNGEQETGLTTFLLRHEIDTGAILLQEKLAIEPNENFGQLHDRMSLLGAELLCQTVALFLDGELPKGMEQLNEGDDEADLKPAPKIFKDDCRIDWDKTALEQHNFIRALSPLPTAWTKLHIPGEASIVLKIYQSTIIEREPHHRGKVGTLFVSPQKQLEVMCKDGVIRIDRLQSPGKKQLEAKDWLNGFTITPTMYFE